MLYVLAAMNDFIAAMFSLSRLTSERTRRSTS